MEDAAATKGVRPLAMTSCSDVCRPLNWAPVYIELVDPLLGIEPPASAACAPTPGPADLVKADLEVAATISCEDEFCLLVELVRARSHCLGQK